MGACPFLLTWIGKNEAKNAASEGRCHLWVVGVRCTARPCPRELPLDVLTPHDRALTESGTAPRARHVVSAAKNRPCSEHFARRPRDGAVYPPWHASCTPCGTDCTLRFGRASGPPDTDIRPGPWRLRGQRAIALILSCLAGAAWAGPVGAETIRVGGTGGPLEAMRLAGEAFHKTHPQRQASPSCPSGEPWRHQGPASGGGRRCRQRDPAPAAEPGLMWIELGRTPQAPGPVSA